MRASGVSIGRILGFHVFAFALFLAACGGSGGGGAAPPPPVASLGLFAGDMGGFGNIDGTGATARLRYPFGVATDSAGNVYVADTSNDTIRKVTPAGVVITFAGSAGLLGSADATGAAARFNSPGGVATDSAGNVYVADTNNHTIRKITSAGVVTTFAGGVGVSGSTDGAGAAARFDFPNGVATDSLGNVYVSDTGNQTIRKITPAGVVTTLAGGVGFAGSTDATGSLARFNFPAGVATDGAANVYVADSGNSTIRKITPAGAVTTLAGMAGFAGSADGTGAAARLNGPLGVATDGAANVYVADSSNHTIRKITPAGVVTTFAGSPGFAGSADGGAVARFNFPYGVATDSAGNVYVADTYNHTIRQATPAGLVTTLAGMASALGSTDATGVAARFNAPKGVATDSAGIVYVADAGNNTVRKITPAGVVTTLAGTAGVFGGSDATGAAASFNVPSGVATDTVGNVYVADTGNNTIRQITPAGVVTTLAGTAGLIGSTDATGAAARFSAPAGVATDSAGNVYVADTGNRTIRKITPAGLVITLAGLAGASGSTDGGGSARFSVPTGVATDSAGNVYVADTNNQTIRKITPAGMVTTLAGTAGAPGNTDGTGAAARFFYPRSLATDSTGNVYVADTSSFTIRKITPAGDVSTVVGVAGQLGYTPGALPGRLGYTLAVAISGTSLYITLFNGVAVVQNRP